MITSHKFAALLLALPDRPFTIEDAEFCNTVTEPVVAVTADGQEVVVAGMGKLLGVLIQPALKQEDQQ